MQLAINLFFVGSGIIALASIADTLAGVPRLLRQLEAERSELANKINQE